MNEYVIDDVQYIIDEVFRETGVLLPKDRVLTWCNKGVLMTDEMLSGMLIDKLNGLLDN